VFKRPYREFQATNEQHRWRYILLITTLRYAWDESYDEQSKFLCK